MALWEIYNIYILLEYLGGDCDLGSMGIGHCTVAGAKMKTTGTFQGGDGLWLSPNAGATNESMFTGFPSGARMTSGDFLNKSKYGYFWTSTIETEHPAHAESRSLNFSGAGISDGHENSGLSSKYKGYSIRCVTD